MSTNKALREKIANSVREANAELAKYGLPPFPETSPDRRSSIVALTEQHPSKRRITMREWSQIRRSRGLPLHPLEQLQRETLRDSTRGTWLPLVAK